MLRPIWYETSDMQLFCFVCQKRRKPQQTETHPARKINDLWVAFSCYFPIGNKGGPNWHCRILESEETCKMARMRERAVWEGTDELVVAKKRIKKKRRSREQDQQMAALNTWDDSITDKSEEEVAGSVGAHKRANRAALDDLRGPPSQISLWTHRTSTRGPQDRRCQRRGKKTKERQNTLKPI